MKKYHLTSIGYSLLNLSFSIGMIALSMVITFFADVFILIAVIFSWLVSLGLLFSLFLCFKHKAMISDDSLIIQNLKTYKILFDDIKEVKMEVNFRTIYIITKEKSYQFPGYFILFNDKKALRLTQELVEEIRKNLNV